MLKISGRRLAGVFVAMFIAAAATPPDASAFGLPGSAAFRRPPAPPPPLIRPNRARSAATATTYTISDVGAPAPTSSYPATAPTSFNNTGQMLGYASYSKKANRQDCVVFTGSKFIDFSSSTTVSTCTPQALSDAVKPAGSSTATVSLVGSMQSIYDTNAVAFGAVLTPSSGALAVNSLTAYSPSALYGVNASGLAAGYYYYNPVGGFFLNEPPITYATASKKFGLLQPKCTTTVAYCLEVSASLTYCAFGGCLISNSGQVFGTDAYTSNYEIYTVSSGVSQDLALPSPEGQFDLNNNNQLLFATYSSGGDFGTHVYNIASKTVTNIPALSGSPCRSYFPLSLSNAGEIVGYTADCGSGQSVYFTWSAASGTQNLSAEIPSSSYSAIAPLGVNDSGQILVALTTSSGTTHWGTLNPSAAAHVFRFGAARGLQGRSH